MRELIEIELERSRRIITDGAEIVPRFTIQTSDGEVTIFVQLPDDPDERSRRMQLVSSYMVVKLATSFVMATELAEPDASSAIAVTRTGCEAGLQLIKRSPLSFGETIWLDRAQIGDEIPALLPPKISSVTAEQIAEVEQLIAHNEGMTIA